jgi:predicted AlkP superfamily phosphohydrolase/phosphomutase
MNSCYPTVSNVAWSCFQTGRNPGGFGVFGFAELAPDMELRFPNASDLRSETIWQILSRADKRVISLGVPLTYPPKPIAGLLAGCFLAPALEKAVYPDSFLPRLRAWGYKLDVDPVKARESLDNLKPDLLACLAGRERTIMELWDSERWDLFVTHVMETDRINHFMWRFLEEPESENGRFFLDFYRRVDDLIGKIVARLDERTEFMILSDHGFCRTQKEAQLNRWLEEQGFLRCDAARGQGFASVTGGQAFALVPGRIHILSRELWTKGTVETAQVAPLREQIIAKLKEWTDPENGKPICETILRREEAFTGPYAERAPDILVHPHDGYDLKAALGSPQTFTHSPISGMHTYHDATLFLRGRNIPGPKPWIGDVMPTLLTLCGVEPPAGLDGRSLVE